MRELDPDAAILPIALQHVRGLTVLAFLFAGCRAADPWPPALALPDHPDDVRWSVLLLDGIPAGVEQRATAGRVVVRQRTWSFVLDGTEETVRAGSRTEGDGFGHATRWTDGVHTWTGAAYVVDQIPPPSTGVWPVLDTGTGEVAPQEVIVDGDVVRWTVAGVPGQADFEHGHLVHASLGRVSLVPGAAHTHVAPMDPAAALSVPVAPGAPEHPVVATFRVGGQETKVEAPLAEELPSAEVAVWRDLVREVGTDGDCDARTARFVRLASARGVEARAVAGLALDRGHDRLAPHAWAEVHTGGRWVAVDPTFGQVPADAARIRLGEVSRPDVVARMLSGTSVELVELR